MVEGALLPQVILHLARELGKKPESTPEALRESKQPRQRRGRKSGSLVAERVARQQRLRTGIMSYMVRTLKYETRLRDCFLVGQLEGNLRSQDTAQEQTLR